MARPSVHGSAGSTRPLTAELANADGRVARTVPLQQSAWGINPYRGLMVALKVRDEVEIVVAQRVLAEDSKP